ncbi:hypothetical protein AVP42_00130 [Agromyces sp. NDB4Y10]|nr:hypothetical protein AVP42_00130 [Agromyces sp. NDB4Y10]
MHRLDADATEESVPGRGEPVGAERVERAGLEVLGRAVLPPRAVARVVVDADRTCPVGVVGAFAPEEPVRRRGREHHVALTALDPGDGRVEVGGVDERRRRLDEDRDVRRRRRLGRAARGRGGRHQVEHLERVEQRRLARRGGVREFGGSRDHLGAGCACDVGDLVVVGRDDDASDAFCGERGVHGAGDERHAADTGDVLAGQPLRAAARRDDRDGRARRRVPSRPAAGRGAVARRAGEVPRPAGAVPSESPRARAGGGRLGEVGAHAANLCAPFVRPVHAR